MDRFTWGIVIGAVLLVIAGIGTAIWVQGRTLPPPDLSSPEGVVRAYVEAVHARNAERAWELLSPSARSEITREEFIRRVTLRSGHPREGRVAIERVEITGNSALVEISRTYSSNGGPFGLFGPSTYSNQQTVRLERARDTWVITVPPEPYLLDMRPVHAVVVTPVPTATRIAARPGGAAS